MPAVPAPAAPSDDQPVGMSYDYLVCANTMWVPSGKSHWYPTKLQDGPSAAARELFSF